VPLPDSGFFWGCVDDNISRSSFSQDFHTLQVLVADINIGYEDIVNTQVYLPCWLFSIYNLSAIILPFTLPVFPAVIKV
jgi:hypothetical protein